ncbi:MAG: O-antigen ligase family protein [Bacteroidota bacterium]
MVLDLRIKIFLLFTLLGTYILRISQLIDEFHVSRFTWLSVLGALACFTLLPAFKRRNFHLLDVLVFGFVGLNLLSLAWAYNFGEAVFTAQKYFLLALLYYLFRHILVEKKDHRVALARVMLLLGAVAALIVSFQMIQTAGAIGLGGKSIYKVIGHSGHKNLVASFFFLILAFNVLLIRYADYKLLSYAIIGWQLLLVLLLRSRAVYIALAIGGVATAFYYVLGDQRYRQIALSRVLPALLGLVIIGGIAVNFSGAKKDYVEYLNPSTYLKSASAVERLFVWHKTKELIDDRPLLGYGSGNWKLFFPSKSIRGGYRLQEKDLVFTRAHNDFLEIWAEVGLVGLLNFLAIFGLAFWAIFKTHKTASALVKQDLFILGIALAGFAIILFFDFPKERLEHLSLFALLLAYTAFRCRKVLENLPLHFELSAGGTKIIAGALLLVLALNIPISYHRWNGDHHCIELYRQKDAKNWPKVLEAAEKAKSSRWYSVDPMVIPLTWYEGLGHYFQPDYIRAAPLFAEAYQLNPYNFNVINNYASTLVQLEQYEKAIELYLKAMDINPKFEDGMFNLSYSYFQLKQYEKAFEWVNKTSKDPKKKADFLEVINQARALVQ